MAVIIIPTFGGETPRTTPRLLEQTQAAEAVNCRLERGALEPLPGPRKVHDLAEAARTIFRHDVDGWLSWPGDVDVVKSAVVDIEGDTPLGHLFLTNDRDYPTQYLAGGDVYRLGIPRPGAAPSVSVSPGAAMGAAVCYAFGAEDETRFPARYGQEDGLETIRDDSAEVDVLAEAADSTDEENPATDSGISRSSTYCYTLVQSLADGLIQQESAPSPASAVVDVPDGDGVTVSGFDIPEMEGLTVTHIRLYRTVSGNESSEFHFLAELEVPVEEYMDTLHDADMSSEVLQTTTWDCIPDDAHGLIYADNGLYACFRGNELLISEPFHAYAWPASYRLTVEDSIVALGHTDSTIVVLTSGRPYLVTGSEPESMQVTHLPIEQSCVSARSVGHLPGGVIYASPDGLMLFTSSEQALLTARTFTRDQWQALKPETLMGTVHDGRYVAFFADTGRGLLFSIGAKDVVRLELPTGWTVQGIHHHSGDDCVYLSLTTPDGNAVYQWEAGEAMPYLWRSKPFFTPALTSMSAVRVEGEQSLGMPVQVTVFGPDNCRPRSRLRLTDTRSKRIPATRAEKLWSLELRGTAVVYEARMGGSVEEVEHGV